MRREVLFVQGAGEGTHDEWDNRLVDSLGAALGPDYEIRYPQMPNEDDPAFASWKQAIEKEFASLNDGAILVGHSVGATILIHAIAARPPALKPGGIFLIAPPFIGDGGWPSEDIKARDELRAGLPAGMPIYLYHGTDDATVPASHVDLYSQAINDAVIRRLTGRDHQLNDDLREVAADISSLA